MPNFPAPGIDVIRVRNAHASIWPSWIEGKEIVVTPPDGVICNAFVKDGELTIEELPHPEGNPIGLISGGSSRIQVELPVGFKPPLVIREHSS